MKYVCLISVVSHDDMESKVSFALARANRDIKGRLDGVYQRKGVEWMLERELLSDVKGGILADDMGLGKTMQAIACMRGNPMPTLIVSMVGPVNQWRDALIEFGGYRPIMLNPSFKGSLPGNVEVVVTTYSSFQKSHPPSCLKDHAWGRIILDEGHCIKNPKSRVYTEISMLTVQVKWILSGTPIQNSEKDMFTLASWIGMDGGGKGVTIDTIVKELVLRRTQDDMATSNPRLSLPPLDTTVVRLKFETSQEADFYRKVEEYFSDIATDKGTEAMTSLTRCRQACTDPVTYMTAIGMTEAVYGKKRKTCKKNTGSVPVWNNEIGCTKTTYMIQDIRNHCNKEKCLVFCMWTEEMASVAQALKHHGIASLIYDGSMSRENKTATLYNFKNTDIPVLIIQINCGSTGLNLQCASRVYITSPNWNPCIELQAIGRAYRKGQVNKVTCQRLVMIDTVEERCMEIQEMKMQLITKAMMDRSFATRLGAMHNDMDDINIAELFKHRAKQRKYEVDEQVIHDTCTKPEANVSSPKHDMASDSENRTTPPEDGLDIPCMNALYDDDEFQSFLDSLIS